MGKVAPLLKLDWRWGFVATALAPVRGGGAFGVGRLVKGVERFFSKISYATR